MSQVNNRSEYLVLAPWPPLVTQKSFDMKALKGIATQCDVRHKEYYEK